MALLGMIGLRVGEAIAINVTDLRSQSGYELLTIMGKRAKPALIPMAVAVLRAVRDATAGRSSGPVLLNRHSDCLTSGTPAAAPPRATTWRSNLDLHAAQAVAAYLAGVSADWTAR